MSEIIQEIKKTEEFICRKRKSELPERKESPKKKKTI